MKILSIISLLYLLQISNSFSQSELIPLDKITAQIGDNIILTSEIETQVLQLKNNGQDVAVYINCKVSVNGKPYKTLINPDIDIANVEWNVFNHSNWILPLKEE